jgi:hypothetical protein
VRLGSAVFGAQQDENSSEVRQLKKNWPHKHENRNHDQLNQKAKTRRTAQDQRISAKLAPTFGGNVPKPRRPLSR